MPTAMTSFLSSRTVLRHSRHLNTRYSSISSCVSLLDYRQKDERSPKCHNHTTTPTIGARRHSSSWIPEFAQHISVWGASGWVLKTIHMNGTIPYWACFSITNIMVRTSLIPFVLHSAHTAARFAKVAPEVQFLVTMYQKDLARQRQEGGTFGEQWMLTRITMQTLGGLYKLHNIHPLAIFLSPLAQIPVFWYFSIDLRKIINGADPALGTTIDGKLLSVGSRLDGSRSVVWTAHLGGNVARISMSKWPLANNLSVEKLPPKANLPIISRTFFQSTYSVYECC